MDLLFLVIFIKIMLGMHLASRFRRAALVREMRANLARDAVILGADGDWIAVPFMHKEPDGTYQSVLLCTPMRDGRPRRDLAQAFAITEHGPTLSLSAYALPDDENGGDAHGTSS